MLISMFKLYIESLFVISILHSAWIIDAKSNDHVEVSKSVHRMRIRRNMNYEYAVVIDAGSSGSRVRVYRWPDRIGGTRVETSGIEVMHPQLKLQPGLSKQVDEMSNVREHIKKLIVNASQHVPPRHHKITPIYFMATAGQFTICKFRVKNSIFYR